jgi:2-keto-4-pentenoate hydratase
MTERLGACVENRRLSSPSRSPVAPLTARRPGLSLEDAYRIQAAGVACRVAAGARVVGHKVGVTSKAMQQQMGSMSRTPASFWTTWSCPAGASC